MSYGDPNLIRAGLAPVVEPLATVTAAELEHMRFTPPRWIVPGFIPDGLSMLAGKPKLGKSWLMLDVAVAVARGGAVLDRKCIQGDVLYLALEDNQRRIQDRLRRVTTGGEWPRRLELSTSLPRLAEGGIEALRGWIGRAADPRLIVVDVFTKVKTIRGPRDGLYDADYQAVVPLKELADETGVAVVVVHHQRKQGSDEDPLDTISGSTGLTGAMDTILVLDRGSEGTTLYARGRDIEEVECAVQFDRRTCRWSNLGDAGEVRMSDERKRVVEVLKEAGEPMSLARIVEATGLAYANAGSLLHRMAKAGELLKARRGSYALPGDPCKVGQDAKMEEEDILAS
jgi:hypothetical protein